MQITGLHKTTRLYGLLIAVFVTTILLAILATGCGGKHGSTCSEADSARIARIHQIEDSIYAFAPSAEKLIDEGLRNAADSLEWYEILLCKARYLSLSEHPERCIAYLDRITRFVKEQCTRQPAEAEQLRLNSLLARTYNCRGAYYHNFHRNKQQVIKLYKDAYDLLANSCSKNNLPNLCANLADAYIQNNDIPRGAWWYRRALFLVDSLKLPEKENVTLYMGLAQIYLSLHDFDTALRYYNATEKYFGHMTPSMQAYYLNNFGNYHYFNKDYHKALATFLRMKRNIERHGMQNNFDMYLCKVNLADVYLNLDSLDEAGRYVDEAERFFRKTNDTAALHYCRTIRIGIATKMGNIAEVKRLLADHNEAKLPPVQYNLTNLRNRYLEKYYEKVGNFREAYAILKANNQYNDSLEHNRSNMRSAEIMARFTSDTLKLHHELAIEHKNATIEHANSRLMLALAAVVVLTLLFVVWSMHTKRKQQKARMDIMNLRLNIVRNRISPHFVFNVLNNKIVKSEHDEATELQKLSRLIRTNLDMSRQPAVTLESELSFVEQYVGVERFLLGDDFTWQINVADDVDAQKVMVPSMFLQILTENAIVHGLKGWEGHKELTIDVTRQQHTTIINVSDNGPGFQATNGTPQKRTGLGIISQTIAMTNEHNKNKIRFEIRNIQNNGKTSGCRATLRIPDGVKFL